MEIIFKRINPKASFILISIFFVLTILFFSKNISSPGLQYDETLFINGALGFKFEWFKHNSFLGIPVYVFPYIGSLKSLIYTPIFKIFGVNPFSIRIPSLIIGTIGLYIPLLFLKRSLSIFKIFIYLGILLSCSNFYILTRNDWGPVALNLFLSSLLYALLFLLKKDKNQIINYLIAIISLLIVFNKLDGVIVIISCFCALSLITTIDFISGTEIKKIFVNKNLFFNIFNQLLLFLPAFILFFSRYFYIKNSIQSLNDSSPNVSIYQFFINSTKSILDPFTVDQYFYDISQQRIVNHYSLYLFIIFFCLVTYIIRKIISYRKKLSIVSLNSGLVFFLIGFLNMIFLFLVPFTTSIHHYYMIVFPFLVGSSLLGMELGDNVFSKKLYRILSIFLIGLISSNLILNINGSLFHWRQFDNGSHSKIWNNEIYSISENVSNILNDDTFVTNIFTSWGFLNQVEALNERKITENNLKSYEIYNELFENDFEAFHGRFLVKASKNPELKNHYFLITGSNNKNNLENVCDDNISKLNNIKTLKKNNYEYDNDHSIIMKYAYTCAYKFSK